ncbi:hypothetical protein GOQ04_24685 [Emticicia sp. ODNR4P]|nr:hypothetical protein [Emticicia sp. ODNR4P]
MVDTKVYSRSYNMDIVVVANSEDFTIYSLPIYNTEKSLLKNGYELIEDFEQLDDSSWKKELIKTKVENTRDTCFELQMAYNRVKTNNKTKNKKLWVEVQLEYYLKVRKERKFKNDIDSEIENIFSRKFTIDIKI